MRKIAIENEKNFPNVEFYLEVYIHIMYMEIHCEIEFQKLQQDR